MPTALIDGDVVLYQCGHACDSTWYTIPGRTKQIRYWKDMKAYALLEGLDPKTAERHREAGDIQDAYDHIKWRLKQIKKASEADAMRLFLTGSGNFRNDVATIQTYKGARDKDARPLHYDAIRQYLVDEYGAEVVDGIEADDALGINQTDDTVICTIDKDLLMVPGLHYNWIKDTHKHVDEIEGLQFFYAQLLHGDKTDSIPGVKGFDTPKGWKKAVELMSNIEDEQEMKRLVGHHYAVMFDNPESRMQEVGDLLWIQQSNRIRWTI